MKDRLDLSLKIGKIKLRNPVMLASGTFGYAEEFSALVSLKKLGALITKSITLTPQAGNPPPRIAEVSCGILNSIGLENPGIDAFMEEKLPYLKKLDIPLIVSIAADSAGEFNILAKRLDKIKDIDGLELNISCPNRIKKGQTELIGQDPQATYKVVREVRKATRKTVITKLSPNVTDIVSIAFAAKKAGSDALSLVNTLFGMAFDIETARPRLGSFYGGLSGPAIKPLALYMVWKVAKKVGLPIIGMGGIMSAEDALEFFIAGARAVAIGTANLLDPKASIRILNGLKGYLRNEKLRLQG